MPVIQLVLSLIVLGIIYKRMIGREIPSPPGKRQVILPVILGVISLIPSLAVTLGLMWILKVGLGISTEGLPVILRSFISAFVSAGFPEELSKMLMMLLCFRVFRKSIRNGYEYILIGAGVGFGFTLFEEFAYGSDTAALSRLFTIAAHMIFGIIMAKHLGTARFKKERRENAAGEYAKAFCLPVLIHTVYDTFTAFNTYLESEDDGEAAIGVLLALAVAVTLFVMQIVLLIRLKKDTGKYCEMSFGSQETAGTA
ncbi:MAG: PrsW family intramembrane metalloprotease [Oscillospiraceae bacterium]|nr:PrsW family intramembrane metalloprotease [Oscillospiraceae bacterium]